MYGEAAINDYYSAYIALVINDRRKQSLCASTQLMRKQFPQGEDDDYQGQKFCRGKTLATNQKGKTHGKGGVAEGNVGTEYCSFT